MIGTLATLPLPDSPPGSAPSSDGHDGLQDILEEHHQIIVPVMSWPQFPRRVLRIAAQAYNSLSQYELLASVLAELA
jgi:isopenicillin-N epimerase